MSRARQEFDETWAELLDRHQPDPVAGFFGPNSQLWPVIGDGAAMLFAPRAVMLQLAHPQISAAGVSSSNVTEQFVPRAIRTFRSSQNMIYGDTAAVEAQARRIYAIHARVRGSVATREPAPFAGKSYHGLDHGLLRWVLATIIESHLYAQELVFPSRGPDALAKLYEELCVFGELFALPRSAMPNDLAGFRRFFAEELSRMTVGPAGFELGQFLQNWVPRPRLPAEIWVVGILPDRFRQAFGSPWNRTRAAAFDAMVTALRIGVRAVPEEARKIPIYRAALRRVAGKPPSRAYEVAGRVTHALERWLTPDGASPSK